MKKLSSKENDFLSGEINYWLENDLITEEQSEKILSLYEIKTRNLRIILFIAGGILLGLGAVSFVAAHWHELPKILRVCIISAAWLASLGAYCYCGMSENRAGRAFLLLSSVIFGAGIFLITRMYNIKLSWTTITGWWIVEVLITSFLARDTWEIYFAQALSFAYLNAINAINLFALEFSNLSRVSVLEFFSPLNAFVLIFALWAAWHFVSKGEDRIIFDVNMLLTLLLTASRMSLCFGGTWALIILVILGAVLSFISRWHDSQTFGLLMLGLFGLLLTWPEFWNGEIFSADVFGFAGKSFWPVVTAFCVAVLMLFNIYRGHIGIGIIFCFLLVSRYFFDHLFGYMPKAWGFTITGIILMVSGLFFGRLKKFFNRV
ncbi:MAG: DUF2157 domain-containing protein [Synergistales bacterium]|nr:DUF2157 domain-containing protein [Synergistales bacterium]MDY6402081.1 DUF2157 domain-containing protein [Synergistales bacterium]MDY6405258.1 DUF2157 domain-containing protein [Synergistales bacterium]MDY6410954.1 DUF2157 domain-containing protein [Synergistales bacterium]MDY6413857.1 DUF2157 domain-containing protein [Synergistales bacterium]